MAGESIIGALRVVLGADSAELESGLSKAEARLKSFGATALKVAAAFGVAMSFKEVASTIKDAIDEISHLSSAAKMIGIPVEELSTLKFAANASSLSLDDLTKSLGFLSKSMLGVATGAKQELVRAFDALGISVKTASGALRPTQDVLLDLADKFAGLKDGAGKTALSMEIFGRAGKDMIPFLNKGRDGIEELRQKAQELGFALSTEVADKAKEFNRSLKLIEAINKGIVIQLAAELLPDLAKLANVYFEVSKNALLMHSASNAIVIAFQSIITVGVATVVIFERLSASIAAYAKIASALIDLDWDKLGAAFANATKVGEETTRIFSTLGDVINKVWSDATPPKIQKNTDAQKEFNTALLAGKNALDNFMDSQRKQIAATLAQAQTVGAAAGEHEKLKVVMEADSVAKANNIVLTDAIRAKIEALGMASANAALQLQGATLTQEMLLPWDLYAQKIENLNRLLALGAISQETYGRAAVKAAQDSINMASQYATEVGTALTTIFKGNKAASIAAAIINTAVAITKALSAYPPPASFIMAGLQAAAGAVQIAAIKSQNVPKFKTGGSFVMPGGMGGSERMIPAMAQPGERVTVEPLDQSSGGGARAREVTISMPNRTTMFHRDEVFALIREINEAISDGARLKLTPA
jgi:hypothetical protein